MGFAEVRLERDRLCRGGAHRPVDVRHPLEPETPQCLREPCPRRRVVRLKLNGSIEVRDRLPLLLYEDLVSMVASEQERLVGVRVDLSGAGEAAGFVRGEVRLNLLG